MRIPPFPCTRFPHSQARVVCDGREREKKGEKKSRSRFSSTFCLERENPEIGEIIREEEEEDILHFLTYVKYVDLAAA